MHELSTVGPVDHQRPEIHKPLPKSLIGTRSRFDPVKFDAGPSGRFPYDFHAETGEAGRGADLDRRVVFETDPQGAGWNGRPPSLEVPNREEYRYGCPSADHDS